MTLAKMLSYWALKGTITKVELQDRFAKRYTIYINDKKLLFTLRYNRSDEPVEVLFLIIYQVQKMTHPSVTIDRQISQTYGHNTAMERLQEFL